MQTLDWSEAVTGAGPAAGQCITFSAHDLDFSEMPVAMSTVLRKLAHTEAHGPATPAPERFCHTSNATKSSTTVIIMLTDLMSMIAAGITRFTGIPNLKWQTQASKSKHFSRKMI